MGTVEASNTQVNGRTGLSFNRIRAVELPGEAETSETWELSEINKTNIRLY